MLYRNSSNSGLRKQCYRENIYRKKSQIFYIVDTCGQENINRELLRISRLCVKDKSFWEVDNRRSEKETSKVSSKTNFNKYKLVLFSNREVSPNFSGYFIPPPKKIVFLQKL